MKKIVKKKNTFRSSEVISLIVITCIISMAMGFLLFASFNSKSNSEIGSKELKSFIEEYNYITDNYYIDINEKEILNEALKAVVDKLGDPYSELIGADDQDYFNKILMGRYTGVGIGIYSNNSGKIIINEIIANSPAEEAGLKNGDIVLKYNDELLANKTSTELVSMIAVGNKNFSLTVLRNEKEVKFNLKKETITLESATSKTYEKNGKKIGYIEVSIFAQNTYEQFKDKLDELEKAGIDSLIIDLRDNSGGHLEVAKEIAGLFLDKTHVIYQTQNKTTTKKVYSSGKETKSYKIVILSNGNSASASEIVMAALQEEYGAIIIGNKSFGKGTIQELVTAEDGLEYKFTTNKWLTPKGTWINEVGIEPNIVINQSGTYYNNPIDENDNQLQKAIETLVS